MKTWSIMIMAVAVLLAACSKPVPYGAPVEGETVTLSSILAEPALYENKTVVVSGKIIRECPSGCWFNLADGNAEVFVDLSPAGLSIPQFVGRDVTVRGTVKRDGPNVQVYADGVVIQ